MENVAAGIDKTAGGKMPVLRSCDVIQLCEYVDYELTKYTEADFDKMLAVASLVDSVRSYLPDVEVEAYVCGMLCRASLAFASMPEYAALAVLRTSSFLESRPPALPARTESDLRKAAEGAMAVLEEREAEFAEDREFYASTMRKMRLQLEERRIMVESMPIRTKLPRFLAAMAACLALMMPVAQSMDVGILLVPACAVCGAALLLMDPPTTLEACANGFTAALASVALAYLAGYYLDSTGVALSAIGIVMLLGILYAAMLVSLRFRLLAVKHADTLLLVGLGLLACAMVYTLTMLQAPCSPLALAMC